MLSATEALKSKPEEFVFHERCETSRQANLIRGAEALKSSRRLMETSQMTLIFSVQFLEAFVLESFAFFLSLAPQRS